VANASRAGGGESRGEAAEETAAAFEGALHDKLQEANTFIARETGLPAIL
jgi:hypothetical protein